LERETRAEVTAAQKIIERKSVKNTTQYTRQKGLVSRLLVKKTVGWSKRTLKLKRIGS
jgi:hypothetical protein